MDRNLEKYSTPLLFLLSLSARRAWIEILYTGDSIRFEIVALRKESVDRNIGIQAKLIVAG